MTHSEQAAENARLRWQLDVASAREAEARRAVGLLNAIIDALPVGVTVQTEDGTVMLENGMAAASAERAGAGVPTSPALPAAGVEEEAAQPADAITMEERVVTGSGLASQRTFLIAHRPVRILDRPLLVSTAFDFTDRKKAELELSKRAYIDELTGLPNGALLAEQVRQVLASSEGRCRFALAFLDIDNFKHINDYYTHAIGDALLLKVAQRISAHIRPSDFAGRISGDEFLLVLYPLDSDEELETLINNLLKELKEPFLIDGYEILTSASIGVSVHPDHGLNYEALRRAADTAMYRAKEVAKGDAALFDSDMGRAMAMRMAQEQRLRLAVRDGRFCCAFQPKVDIRTEEVVGVEALIRLRDEDGVIQSPGQFIALAIELGLIDDITYLALAEIVRSMDMLDDAFGSHATISINIAAKRAGDAKFMDGFCEELQATGYANRFMVEVTEDAFFAGSKFQQRFIPMLREIGTRVSVDDFGTGYSSLATLADVTADEIKIDRSFITAIHERPRSQSVLKAIEALSDALGMTVIAEGVETFEEVAYLQAASRIRFAQGYYFAKPIFLEELAPARRVAGEARSGASARYRTPARR
ncbi:MAG: EAL domain-containing protein [Xanthobacteraceae bacterium]